MPTDKSYSRRPLRAAEVLQVLESPDLELTSQQRKTVALFAKHDGISVEAIRIAHTLARRRPTSGKTAFSQPSLGGSKKALNHALRSFRGGVVRLYATSPNATFYRLYFITAGQVRSEERTVAQQEESIRHGLLACRRFGCVIKDCKENHRCEFAQALAAVGGDPEHYRITTPDEAYANSQK